LVLEAWYSSTGRILRTKLTENTAVVAPHDPVVGMLSTALSSLVGKGVVARTVVGHDFVAVEGQGASDERDFAHFSFNPDVILWTLARLGAAGLSDFAPVVVFWPPGSHIAAGGGGVAPAIVLCMLMAEAPSGAGWRGSPQRSM